MTKHFVRGLKGVFIGKFVIQTKHKIIDETFISSSAINGGQSKRQIIENAKLGVLYKYSYSRGQKIDYSVIIHLIDFDIEYLGTKGKKPLISVKRRNRKLKARRIKDNGGYKTQIYDTKDNYIISTEKWKSGDINKINTKKTKTQITEVTDTKTKEVLIKQKYKKYNATTE